MFVYRKLGSSGQKLGACSALCHIRCLRGGGGGAAEAEAERMNHYELHVSNVGDVEVVLCRRGEAMCVTRKFTTNDDAEECNRVYQSDGIITEVRGYVCFEGIYNLGDTDLRLRAMIL